MSAAQRLLARIVDYAGLFPPAALDMEQAVRNYQSYLRSDDVWMLGSFLVPARRLREFRETFERVCCGEREEPWTLGIVCAGETADDARAIEEFQEGAAYLAELEAKAADARELPSVLQRLPAAGARYVEFPPDRAGEMLPALRDLKSRAKLRTGGVAAESIPPVETVADFLLACARERVAWKATAGLHHAVRGAYALSDEPAGPRATMHGFLNLFLAGALAWSGASRDTIVRTLQEEEAAAFHLGQESVHWHEHEVGADQLQRLRTEFAISFGSCSFTDPVAEIKALRQAKAA